MQFHIKTVFHTKGESLVLRLRQAVMAADDVHRVIVGDHDSFETPLFLEDIV